MGENIFLEIEYVGTNYFGFQIQEKKDKSEITVQEVLEKALENLLREKVRITYSSRTDKGVHARAQAVNFTTDRDIPLSNIKRALNSFLPYDVRVRKVKRVPEQFHSRFWVKSKVYRYIISNKKESSVFWHNFSWHIDKVLNIDYMLAAAAKLVGKHDFSVFAKDAKKYKTCVREIKNISIKKRGGFIYIDIEADGFLRGMARNIVFFLVKAGKQGININDIRAILHKQVSYVNKPAPACGLYLLKVQY